MFAHCANDLECSEVRGGANSYSPVEESDLSLAEVLGYLPCQSSMRVTQDKVTVLPGLLKRCEEGREGKRQSECNI